MPVRTNLLVAAMILVVLGITIAIGYGYLSFFDTVFRLNHLFAVFATVVLTLFLFNAIRRAGIDLDRLVHGVRTPGAVTSFSLWYLAVFMLSAIGVIRFAMFFIVGPEIARQDAQQLIAAYRVIANREDDIFATKVWDNYKATVTAQFDAIKNDMNGTVQGYCGVGRIVRPQIDTLASELPGFVFIAGSDSPEVHKCQQPLLGNVIAQYQREFDNAMEHSPTKLNDHVAEKSTARASADEKIGENTAALRTLVDDLNRVNTFIFDEKLYDRALRALQHEQHDFLTIRAAARRFVDADKLEIPNGIDIDYLRALQSPTDVFYTVVDEIAKLSLKTLMFIVFALGTDFVLVLSIFGARRLWEADDARRIAFEGPLTLPGTSTIYLWTAKLTVGECDCNGPERC
jgi:hypothetical protein